MATERNKKCGRGWGGGGGIQTMSSTSHVNCVSVGGGWGLNSRVATCCRKLKCPPGGGG